MQLSNISLAITRLCQTGFFPGAALDLDLTAGNQTLDPRVTFTRASSATRINASGVLETVATDTPRFDYDPVTLAPKGLMIEEQRTNLLLRSSNYSATWFTANVTPTANTTDTIDPAGGNGATRFVMGAAVGALGQSVVSTAIAHTGSVYLKTNTGTTTVELVMYRNSPFGLVTSKTVTLTTSWQRFDVIGTFIDTTAHNFQINFGTSKTVYVYGAQLEVGSFPTSYIPTTTAAATRAADVAVMTGANFSSWYRQDEGTLFAEGDFIGGRASTFPSIVSVVGVNRDTDAIYIPWTANNGQMCGAVVSGGTNSFDQAVGPNVTAGTALRAAIAFKADNTVFASGGSLSSVGTSVTLPTVTTLQIGQPARYQPHANSHIRRLAFFPRRLANSELQAITT